MSFLLDALKKSEQERQQQQVPSLQTQHAIVLITKNRIWPWVLGGVLLIILNIMLYLWFFTKEEPINHVTPQNISHYNTKIIPEEQENNVVLPLVHLKDMPIQELITSKKDTMLSKPFHVEPIQSSEVLSLAELSTAQRKSIGSIDISAHFYGQDQQSRIVMIDGNTWHEKQDVRNGLKVEKITENGLVLNYRGLRFSMQAFQSLQP